MQRVALINGKNKNQDYDLSKIFSSIATSGIVDGLEVQNGKVTSGYAFIEVERNGVVFNVLFQNTEDLVIDTTGTKKVFIEINQSNIDDGTTNSSDGTGIGEIKTALSYPTKNYIALASITSGVITDERSFIKIKPLSFDLIKLEKNGTYPQWCKIGRLKTPDGGRFKIDLIGGLGYGTYGYANGGSLVRIIGGVASGFFTIGGNWTENNGLSGITEIQMVEITDQEFDLYVYFTSGSNPYGELLMKFDGGNNTKFTKNFSVSTPTGGVVFPKITPGTDIVGLAEKTNMIGEDLLIISDNESGGVNKKIKLSNALKSNKTLYVAGENITAGNALSLHSDGRVYKTLANDTSRINFIGFASNTVNIYNNVTVDLNGLNNNQSGLTIGATYYLTNTLGVISTTPGTYLVSVGKAVSTTSININNVNDRIGNYQSKSFNTNYQAETSGYVIATSTGAQYSNTTTDTIIGYIGSSNPAGTMVARSTLKGGNAMSEGCSIMFPVSKGQWYRCTASTSSGYSYFSMSFIPNT